MGRYLLQRIAQAVPLILIVSVICFGLLHLTTDPLLMYNINQLTGDDIIRLRTELGLDRPVYVQYLAWLGKAIRLDWGYSFASQRPVIEIIAERLPRSLALAVSAEGVVLLAGMGMALYSVMRPYSLLDNLLTFATFVVYSMPIFWLALVLMYVFAVYFKHWGLPYLPTGGDVWDTSSAWQWIRHLVLPVLSLAGVHAAITGRYLRSAMLDVVSQDYMRTARAKGLTEPAILVRHALRNAAIPLVTLVGMELPGLVAGAIVTETMFSWPGLGRLFWEGINRGDYPVVMGILFLVSLLVVLFQLLVDVTYTLIDPRIRYS